MIFAQVPQWILQKQKVWVEPQVLMNLRSGEIKTRLFNRGLRGSIHDERNGSVSTQDWKIWGRYDISCHRNLPESWEPSGIDRNACIYIQILKDISATGGDGNIRRRESR